MSTSASATAPGCGDWCGVAQAHQCCAADHRAQRATRSEQGLPQAAAAAEPAAGRVAGQQRERRGRGVETAACFQWEARTAATASCRDVRAVVRRRPQPRASGEAAVCPSHQGRPAELNAIGPARSWGAPFELRIQPGLVGCSVDATGVVASVRIGVVESSGTPGPPGHRVHWRTAGRRRLRWRISCMGGKKQKARPQPSRQQARIPAAPRANEPSPQIRPHTRIRPHWPATCRSQPLLRDSAGGQGVDGNSARWGRGFDRGLRQRL